jgi:hypothetical protein
VASLASQNRVLVKLFLIDDVGMASLACAVPGERNRSRGHLADRRTPIVTILTKTARHDRGAQNHERDQGYDHDGSQPNEVFEVLKQASRSLRCTAPRYCAQDYVMRFDTGNSSGERRSRSQAAVMVITLVQPF